MNIVLDESVSYALAEALRREGHHVTAIADAPTAGNTDEEVYALVYSGNAVLITRDFHFTNPVRFPSAKTSGIIYIRHGNLSSEEEVRLVMKFLEQHPLAEFRGRLATLYRDSIKIR